MEWNGKRWSFAAGVKSDRFFEVEGLSTLN